MQLDDNLIREILIQTANSEPGLVDVYKLDLPTDDKRIIDYHMDYLIEELRYVKETPVEQTWLIKKITPAGYNYLKTLEENEPTNTLQSLKDEFNYRQNHLRVLKEKKAKFGDLHVPAYIETDIRDTEEAIKKLKIQIKAIEDKEE